MINIVYFIMIHLSLSLCVIMHLIITKRSRRSSVRTGFAFLLWIMLIWNIGTVLEMDFRFVTGQTNMLFINICYVGICLSPIAILYFGKTIFEPAWRPSFLFLLTLVIPLISIVMVCTNDVHYLFFEVFSVHSNEAIYGAYFYFHTVYSYGCIVIGLIYLITFSIRNTGLFSGQSLLIMVGITIPLAGNIAFSFSVFRLEFGINASLFTIAILCFMIAFYRYRFLTALPISVRQIVDLISDGYLVVDGQFFIVDYNKAFLNMLPESFLLNKDTTLKDIALAFEDEQAYEEYAAVYHQSETEQRTVSAQRVFADGRYFDMEITPVFQRNEQIGGIILFQDVTQTRMAINTIQKTHAMMIDRERLISLGQIASGIAHNLRTPLFSIAGGLVAIKDLVQEYEDSTGDPSVTEEDHKEISEEMNRWIIKIEEHCDYLAELVATIRSQAVSLNSNENDYFSIDEMTKRIELLMMHELKISHVELSFEININPQSLIAGDISNLVQVFDNLIINAIHAYEERSGKIILRITRDNDYYIFDVHDFAGGIPQEIIDKIFHEMITTKGHMGTGLGLYISYSTIKGKFNGKMTVESTPGEGTQFHIWIPIPK